ncbi:MAG: STAS domain-containing protein [Bacilli bacterium]|nr:STAS domain-containing protein [Bacilli bacterium]MDD4644061.1 STAS domain-containing protein [Bacilli bacterium]
MLDIDMEYTKGILFVRLKGKLSIDNCIILDNELGRLVDGNNVRFVTFNVFELTYIDMNGIKAILKYNAALSKIKGKVLICGVNNEVVRSQLNRKVTRYILETKDELSAIKHINLGGYI